MVLRFAKGFSGDLLFGYGKSILDYPRPAHVRARCLMNERLSLLGSTFCFAWAEGLLAAVYECIVLWLDCFVGFSPWI